MVYLHVGILILLFLDSLEFALEDALQSGKFWIEPGEKNEITKTPVCRFDMV